MLFLILQSEKAKTLEEQTNLYSPFLEHPLHRELPFKDIYFDQGDFRIRDDAKPVLRENAEILILYPDINIAIVGYCNKHEYNPKHNLGYKRAESSMGHLTDLGIESDRITLKTICSNDTDKEDLPGGVGSEWLLNNRVHFTVLNIESEKVGLKSNEN